MIRKLRHKTGKKRAKIVVARILPFIKDSQKIIDVGCGTGHIAALLQEKGKDVTAVDVADKSLEPGVEVIFYDGKSLPFPDAHFDTSLLLTVLHHTPDPAVVFSEAARVGKELVVIETLPCHPERGVKRRAEGSLANARSDIHQRFFALRIGGLRMTKGLRTSLSKLFIVLADSLINRQPRFYWHSYKSDEEWKKFFEDRGFEVVAIQYHRDTVFGIPYHHAIYYLKRAQSTANREKVM